MKPLEFNVLVLPRVVQRQRASGIFVPENAAQREDEGGDEGLLVAISPLAFNEEDFPNPDAIPKVGEHVMFARYAGKSFVGADGRVYRVMKDKEIVGIRTAAATSAQVAA
jgi:co-chaperonin GroES (HSP10)